MYKDFRTAVLDILNALENQEAVLNGVTGMGRGIHDIPGSIVSVDTAPSQVQAPHIADQVANASERSVTNAVITQIAANAATAAATMRAGAKGSESNSSVIVTQQPKLNLASTSAVAADKPTIPPVIWVIGGPGSNKATLCLKAIGLNPGWGHIR